jgi:hypothetical protein
MNIVGRIGGPRGSKKIVLSLTANLTCSGASGCLALAISAIAITAKPT